jgi:hypothetical protein
VLSTPFGEVVVQGLFEKRQPEVSVEFSEFLATRVLTSPRLIDELANGKRRVSTSCAILGRRGCHIGEEKGRHLVSLNHTVPCSQPPTATAYLPCNDGIYQRLP